jgi:hypothetical protein
LAIVGGAQTMLAAADGMFQNGIADVIGKSS